MPAATSEPSGLGRALFVRMHRLPKKHNFLATTYDASADDDNDALEYSCLQQTTIQEEEDII